MCLVGVPQCREPRRSRRPLAHLGQTGDRSTGKGEGKGEASESRAPFGGAAGVGLRGRGAEGEENS